MSRRGGSGVRVGGGRLRVDAARAIDKLRSYQLADPLAWVLEVVRAGVLSPECQGIAVTGSGGDVFVAITCAPPSSEVLPRLFEELVDPSSDPRARGLRLLAMGVNSALGRAEGEAATRHVDVYVIDDTGSERVRFTPQLFAVERETGIAKGLRALAKENAAPPAHAPRPRRGILVHARAVMSLGLLARWAVGDEPRELAMVRDAARELRVPLTVDGLPVAADPAIVMREPLGSGGYVALVTPRPGRVGAMLEAAEGGVVLSREPWNCGIGDAAAVVPLLLRVDRERLPTNAARSAVRWDEPVAASALEEAGPALERLVRRLAKEIDEAKDEARLSWLRVIGLTLLAAEVRGVAFRERLAGGVVRDVIAPLLDAKLLLDAVGRRRTPRELARHADARVYLESTYAPRELAPWLGDVMAAPPGDPTHMLFGDLPPLSAAGLVAQATFAKQNHERWLARPVEPARVREPGEALVKIALPEKRSVKGRPAFTLEGEVVLGVPGDERTIELRIGGRLLETRRARIGVGIAAVANCDALAPALGFDAAVEDEVQRSVLEAIDDAIVRGCELLARLHAGERVRRVEGLEMEPERARADPRSAALVRHGVLALARGGDVDGARRAVLKKPLGRAAVWPRVGGDAVSIDALAAADAIGIVEVGRALPPALPHGRPVLALGDEARTTLRLLLPRARMVDYARVRTARRTAGELALLAFSRGASVGLARESDAYASMMAWAGREGSIEAFHLGVRMGLHTLHVPSIPVQLVVDDDRIVPDETWQASSVDWLALEEQHQLRLASSRIAYAIVRAWLGDVDPALVHEAPLDTPAIVRAVLVQARTPFETPLDAEARRALGALPLLVGLDGERTSADAIRADDGRIAFVPPGTFAVREVSGLPLRVMIGSREEAEGLAALVGARGTIAVEERVRSAYVARQRQARLEAVMVRPEESLELGLTSATTAVRGDGLEGTLGYQPRAGAGRFKLLVDRRRFADLDEAGLPPHVVAKISIEPRLLDPGAERLGDVGVPRVRGAIHASARELLVRMVVERPGMLFGDAALRELADFLVGGGRRRGELGAMLRALMEPPTLGSARGTPIAIRDAIVDDELLALYEPLEPVDRAEGDAPSVFDRPLAVLPWEPSDARGILLQKIAGVAVRDVTREVRALYAERRARRGLVPRPKLGPGHERVLTRAIESLMRDTDDEAKVTSTLGIGEIGLIKGQHACVRFFDAGREVALERFELVPAFEAAVESPLVSRGHALGANGRVEVEPALTALLARLLRVLADEHAFDAAPDWALDAQRDAALLGGALHLERLGPLRLFPTTAGGRVSYDEIKAQRVRFGPVWWTPDPSCTLTPLDPERIALRLSPGHAAALGRAVSMMEGSKELELDRIARQNRARAPIDTIEPTSKERQRALGVETERTDDAELVVMVLWPARADERELALFLDRQPLGTGEHAGAIPVRARVRSSALGPNRTWDGAMRDETLLGIERRIAELADEIVARAFPAAGGPFPSVVVDASMMASVPHPKQRVVRGVLTLGALDEDEDAGVRVVDRLARDPDAVTPAPIAATAPKRSPAAVPLEGTLVLWGDDRRTAETTIDAVARHAYQRLLGQLAHRVANGRSPDADLDRAHLVRGAELGFVQPKELRVEVPMPFGRGALGTLRGIVDVLESSSAVVALTPEEAETNEPDAHLARQPMFVADGSLAAQRLALALGPRAISRSDALALALGLRKASAHHASIATPPTTTKKKNASIPAPPPAAPAKAGKKKKKADRATSGPVEPLAARTSAVLARVGHGGQVVVQASRTEPLVQGTGDVTLAGNHALLALAAGLHRERAASLVAAHVISQGPSTHLALGQLARLLR